MAKDNIDNIKADVEHAFEVKLKGKSFPSIWAGILSVVAFLGLQILFGIVAVIIAVAYATATSQVPVDGAEAFGSMEFIALPSIWAMVASNMVVLIALYFYLRRDGRSAAIELNRWSQIGWVKTTGISVAVIAVILGFSLFYQNYIFPDVELQGDMQKLLAAIPDTLDNNILMFFAIAILAPVVEELVFRGMLQGSLMNHMPPYAAIALASVIFAAIHFQPYAFPILAVLGAAFGYLYYVTGSLRVSIAAHVLNNALAVLLPYLEPYAGG